MLQNFIIMNNTITFIFKNHFCYFVSDNQKSHLIVRHEITVRRFFEILIFWYFSLKWSFLAFVNNLLRRFQNDSFATYVKGPSDSAHINWLGPQKWSFRYQYVFILTVFWRLDTLITKVHIQGSSSNLINFYDLTLLHRLRSFWIKK